MWALGTAGVPGTVTDITVYTTKIEVPRQVAVADVTVFSNQAKVYIAGLQDGTISMEGKFDPVINTQLGALFGVATQIAFRWGPQGAASGKARVTGNCFITDYAPGGDVASEISYKATFQITGPVVLDTFP